MIEGMNALLADRLANSRNDRLIEIVGLLVGQLTDKFGEVADWQIRRFAALHV